MGEGRKGEERKVGEQRKVYSSIKAIKKIHKKGTFASAYRLCSDIAAIGPSAGQGTAWVLPAR